MQIQNTNFVSTFKYKLQLENVAVCTVNLLLDLGQWPKDLLDNIFGHRSNYQTKFSSIHLDLLFDLDYYYDFLDNITICSPWNLICARYVHSHVSEIGGSIKADIRENRRTQKLSWWVSAKNTYIYNYFILQVCQRWL